MAWFKNKTGLFKPTWESLEQYQCPDWFRDAKFGLWSLISRSIAFPSTSTAMATPEAYRLADGLLRKTQKGTMVLEISPHAIVKIDQVIKEE